MSGKPKRKTIETIDIDDSDDEIDSESGLSSPRQVRGKAKSPDPILPKNHTDALMKRIKSLVSLFADEEIMNGNKVFYWNIVSQNEMTKISYRVPLSIEELNDLAVLKEDVVKEYGDRLIKGINAFVEQHNLQKYMSAKPKKQQKSAEDQTSPDAVLPKKHTDALMKRIHKLICRWADEQMRNGKKVFYWDIMNQYAKATIASKVPLSIEELNDLAVLEENVLKKYGNCLIENINAFLEQNNLQKYISGIPITSATTLSIEKTATLLQKLFDLREEQNVELPDFISSKVDDLLKEQHQFVKDIDKYLQSTPDESRLETFTAIVKTCPEFLATQKRGRLPCWRAAEASSPTNTKCLISFAELGMKHDIGGIGSRGGLLVQDVKGFTALKKIQDPNVFDALKKHNPPLFYKEDVQRYGLVHCAAKYHSLDLVKYFHKLDPSCLQSRKKNNKLPIHYAVCSRGKNNESTKVMKYLLQQGNEAIGSLFETVTGTNDLILDLWVERWGRQDVWDCIESALSTSRNLDNLPILHKVIEHTPQYSSEVMNRFPNSVHVRDPNNYNRLPIHVALVTGMKLSLELTCIINSSQEHLK